KLAALFPTSRPSKFDDFRLPIRLRVLGSGEGLDQDINRKRGFRLVSSSPCNWSQAFSSSSRAWPKLEFMVVSVLCPPFCRGDRAGNMDGKRPWLHLPQMIVNGY